MAAKILFVDDETDQAKLVQRMFRRKIRAGELYFLFATDGEEALDVMRQESDIDIVVTDINMPRMDGLTLLERIETEDLKALVVSAYGDMQNIRTAMNRGAFDFVTKPVDFDDLEATLQKTYDALEEVREYFDAHPDHVNREAHGATPLGIAVYHGHVEIVRYLLELGADPSGGDENPRAQLEAAIESGHSEVAHVLRKYVTP